MSWGTLVGPDFCWHPCLPSSSKEVGGLESCLLSGLRLISKRTVNSVTTRFAVALTVHNGSHFSFTGPLVSSLWLSPAFVESEWQLL